MRKIFTFLFAALMSVGMWAQTETLLTTITATGIEQASLGLVGIRLVGHRQCCRRIHHHQMRIL